MGYKTIWFQPQVFGKNLHWNSYNTIIGYHVELNTLLRQPKEFDFSSIQARNKYTITLEWDRVFPLHIAILLIDKEWDFYGYSIAHSATVKDGKTTVEFEVLTIFSSEEQKIYRQKIVEVGKLTGEVN